MTAALCEQVRQTVVMGEAKDEDSSARVDDPAARSPIPPGAKVVVFDFQTDGDDEWTVRCTWCRWAADGFGGRSAMHEAMMAHRNAVHPDTWVPDDDTP